MTKLAGDHAQVLVSGYELTGDSNRIAINEAVNTHDVTAFGDAVHKFIPGQRMSAIDHAGYLNRDDARSHPVLKGVDVNGVVSVLVGQNAAPVVGDPTFSLLTQQNRYSAIPERGTFIPFSAYFATRGDVGGWGVALAVPISFTNSTNGSAVDNGAATTNGGAAFLHVLQKADNDTYVFTIQGADNIGFTTNVVTLATFTTLNANALGSERVAIVGTLPRYTRWKAVRTGSMGNTVKIAVSLIRF